jgi:hypothetical protein
VPEAQPAKLAGQTRIVGMIFIEPATWPVVALDPGKLCGRNSDACGQLTQRASLGLPSLAKLFAKSVAYFAA